jgi:glycosyltransferase involved in cell wall biosynthesis
MALGCPVVVTPEVGLARLVRQSGAGTVVRGEAHSFAAAVRDLNSDELRRRRAGLAGRRAAAEHLSWQGVARQTEHMYRDLVSRARARGRR